MSQITVASQNPVKLRAALTAFERIFPQQTFTVTGVAGGFGRARSTALGRRDDAWRAQPRRECPRRPTRRRTIWVGIEGGIEDTDLGMSCFARVHLLDRGGLVGLGQTAVFYLPREVAALVRAGMELGHADDQVFQRDNSKQANGAIGILTDDVIDREAYYIHAVIMALVPFKNPTLSW